MENAFIVDQSDDHGLLYVALGGEIDMVNADAVLEHIAASMAASTATALVVDLSAVTFFDSSGIATLLRLRRQTEAMAVRFEVIKPNGIVLRILEAAGVLEYLNEYPPDADHPA